MFYYVCIGKITKYCGNGNKVAQRRSRARMIAEQPERYERYKAYQREAQRKKKVSCIQYSNR